MKEYGLFIFVCNIFIVFCNEIESIFKNDFIDVKSFVFFPNATIPFYINPDHFDHEQSLAIMTALSMFAFKTCLKFVPSMTAPLEDHHALVFVNPEGVRRCVLATNAHSVYEPHKLVLGYDCLQSPNIDMMIMKALGFSFEHNRASRDLFVEILMENIEPSAVELFTKEAKLPLELRSLPYDINSVMHFGNRDFSKNGHRTMIFKDHTLQQNRVGLTPTDLRKIEIVYGPECLKRDRQEKIELCQSYPGVARRKRSAEVEGHKSLRVNPDITPPPDVNSTTVDEILKDLGIEDDVQNIVEQIYKVTSTALLKARFKYCNNTKPDLRSGSVELNKSSDILGIVEGIAKYAKNTVDNALTNLTELCDTSKSLDIYLRACPYYDQAGKCRQSYYKSTKSMHVRHSTQHRPIRLMSTKHRGRDLNKQYVPLLRARLDNETEPVTEAKETANQDIEVKKDRRKRHMEDSEVYSTKGIELRMNKDKKVKREVTKDDKKDLRMGTTIEVMKKGVFGGDRRSNARKSRVRKVKKNIPPTYDAEEDDKTEDEVKSEEEVEPEEMTTKKAKARVHKKEEDIGILKQKQEQLVNKARAMKKGKRSFIPKTITLSKANKEFYDERKWPGGVVRYMISREKTKKFDIEDLRQRLEEVNSILRKKTCVKLREITEAEAKKYSDYIVLDTSPDYVTGRVGGRQNFGAIELFQGGQHRQHAAMMVMAILGFYFEVARHDRDKHIRVHMRHVRADKLHHFEKIREDATMALPYDYQSATHPAWQFWRKIGKTGISTVATYKDKDPDGSVMKSLGQNEKLLSDLDIVKINSVYGIKCFRKDSVKEKKEMSTD